jgi:glycine hydroxymethyltransferase
LAESLLEHGLRLVSGGTDNHLLLVDVSPIGLTGKAAERILDAVHITVNKNAIPFDTNPPMVASGIRLGTPALTTRGMHEAEFRRIGQLIACALKESGNEATLAEVRRGVAELVNEFPLYPERLEQSQLVDCLSE